MSSDDTPKLKNMMAFHDSLRDGDWGGWDRVQSAIKATIDNMEFGAIVLDHKEVADPATRERRLYLTLSVANSRLYNAIEHHTEQRMQANRDLSLLGGLYTLPDPDKGIGEHILYQTHMEGDATSPTRGTTLWFGFAVGDAVAPLHEALSRSRFLDVRVIPATDSAPSTSKGTTP